MAILWLAHSTCLFEETDGLHAPNPEHPPTAWSAQGVSPAPVKTDPSPQIMPIDLPAPETATYRVRYGIFGQVAEATITFSPGPKRTVRASGHGNGAVLGFGKTDKRIEGEFDLQTLKTTRWTIVRQSGDEKVIDLAEQTEPGLVSLVRKREGRPDEADKFSRPSPVLDPLGLLLRLRFAPLKAPSSFEVLDGRALWVIRLSAIHATDENPPTLRLDGYAEPICWDGSPDEKRTGRDFSLFLSNDSYRTPVRLVVPYDLGEARAEIVHLSRPEAARPVRLKAPVTYPSHLCVPLCSAPEQVPPAKRQQKCFPCP